MSLTAAILGFRGDAGESFYPLDPAERLPLGAKGSYALVLRLDEPRPLRIGRLGSSVLPVGCYVYCGSALGGLRGRIERHQRVEKRLHWHVDYLLEAARLTEVWVARTSIRLECSLAAYLLGCSEASAPVRGFGSSDCRCPSHLLHWADPRDMPRATYVTDKMLNKTYSSHTGTAFG